MDACLHRGCRIMCYIKCALEEAVDCHKTEYNMKWMNYRPTEGMQTFLQSLLEYKLNISVNENTLEFV
jgi:hypothetical protein